MINKKDYEYIEITRCFPLTANDFKFESRKDEDVRKIKQHQRIENIILESFPNIKEIEKKLSNDDQKLVEEYKKCGFSIGEISLLCREVSLQTAIQGFVFDNKGALDEISANIMGLEYKYKDTLDTPANVKEAIRLDASGYFPAPAASHKKIAVDGKFQSLNENYIKDLNDDSKYNFIGGRVKITKEKIKNPDGKWEICKKKIIVDKQKIINEDIPACPAEEYNLNLSDDWKNILSKFKNFKNIEGKIIKALQGYRIDPKTIKDMGTFEFKDLLGRYYGQKNSDGAYMFTGSVNKRVMKVFSSEETCQLYSKYLRFKRKSDKEIDLRIKLAKEKGIMNEEATHHIIHVSNAGKHLNYNHINEDDNLLIVSKFLHSLIHSNDKEKQGQNSNKVCGLFPKKENFDMMLSITPIFRIKYSGAKENEKNVKKSLVGVFMYNAANGKNCGQ